MRARPLETLAQVLLAAVLAVALWRVAGMHAALDAEYHARHDCASRTRKISRVRSKAACGGGGAGGLFFLPRRGLGGCRVR